MAGNPAAEGGPVTFSKQQFKYSNFLNRFNWWTSVEASSHDRIKMTKFWLEYDRKIFTPKNINIGTRQKIHNDKQFRHAQLQGQKFVLHFVYT